MCLLLLVCVGLCLVVCVGRVACLHLARFDRCIYFFSSSFLSCVSEPNMHLHHFFFNRSCSQERKEAEPLFVVWRCNVLFLFKVRNAKERIKAICKVREVWCTC